MPSAPSQTRIVPRTRDEKIARMNIPTHWWRDLYHHALILPWPWFALIGSGIYIAVNAVFAGLYMLQAGSIQGARPGSFLDAFFFSVQCISTIGFGTLTPATLYANVLTTAEAILSLALVALATGSVFARISRPRARVMFAKHAVVAPYNGTKTLFFRIGNQRASQILEAEVSVTLLRYERTLEGEVFRRFYDLPLARSHTPVFALTFTVMHHIEPDSPLAGASPSLMGLEEVEFLISVTGLEEVTSQTVHARHSYSCEEVLWDRRFANIFDRDASGRRFIDYSRFHHTEPALVGDG